MGKTAETAVHTNVVVVTFAGALKTVLLAVIISVFPDFKPDPILQEAIGTIILTLLCWKLRGDLGLQNKIAYIAPAKESADSTEDKPGT